MVLSSCRLLEEAVKNRLLDFSHREIDFYEDKENIQFWCGTWSNAQDVEQRFLNLQRNGIMPCFTSGNLIVKNVERDLWLIIMKTGSAIQFQNLTDSSSKAC